MYDFKGSANELFGFEKNPILREEEVSCKFISQVANMPSIIVIGDFTISNESSNALLGEKLAQQAEAQHLLSAEMTLDVYHTLENK